MIKLSKEKLKYLSPLVVALLFAGSVLVFKLTDPSANQETYASCQDQADDLYADTLKMIPEGVELGILDKKNVYQATERANQQKLENIALCNDLDAQQAMSKRTHWGLFVGLWGLIAIVATLWQAQLAAKMAIGANVILRAQYIARPLIERITIKVGKDIAVFELKLKNVGETEIVSGNIVIRVLPFVQKHRVTMLQNFADHKWEGFSVPTIEKGATKTLTNLQLLLGLSALITESSSDRMKVSILIRYEDIFGKMNSKTFHASIDIRASMVDSGRDNEMRIV